MPATSAGMTVAGDSTTWERALAVKLVHSLVQAVQCDESNAEHTDVDGNDHEKNIEVVGHGRSLLITDKAAAGRKRLHRPNTPGPGRQPPWLRRVHPLLP